MDAVRRVWAIDGSLWTDDPEGRAECERRLGWLRSPADMRAHVGELRDFAAGVVADGLQHVVLCGMGGSSLVAEVLARMFGPADGFPSLVVLDTTDPRQIGAVEDWVDPRRALFVIASKSGGTLETDCLRRHFTKRLRDLGIESPGRHLVAITDPGSDLGRVAREGGYRACFENDPDIGGRYSALSYFGLVPAALLGMDLDRLLDAAEAEARRCRPADGPPTDAIQLGAAMGALGARGVDKLTILCSESLRPFTMWAEQLVAESTGKQGRDGPVGIVPVVDEPDDAPLGADRFVVRLELAGEETPGGVPDDVPQSVLPMSDLYEVGALFFRFEMATALAAVLLGINPFDQPDVAAAKSATAAVLEEEPPAAASGSPEDASPEDAPTGAWLPEFLAPVGPGDYVGYLAYLPPEPELTDALRRLVAATSRAVGAPVTIGFGPRYLHSTGQLHKGGTDRGVFVLLEGPAAGEDEDIDVPGRPYTFGRLFRAQAEGDYRTLSGRGRRIVWARLDAPVIESLDGLVAALDR